MSEQDKLVDAIADLVLGKLKEQLGGSSNQYVSGIYVAAEAQPGLHKVQLAGGEIARFVPAFAHVTGLAAAQTVTMIRGKGTPLTIIGRNTGDITLASI